MALSLTARIFLGVEVALDQHVTESGFAASGLADDNHFLSEFRWWRHGIECWVVEGRKRKEKESVGVMCLMAKQNI